MNRLFAAALLLFAAAGTALASPSVEFTCNGPGYSARINFDEEWSTAFVEDGNGSFEMRAIPADGGQQGSFAFGDGAATLRGLGVEATLTTPADSQVQCWQTGDSQKAIALYGSGSPDWSPYNAPGRAWQTVRAGPSTDAAKIASLPDNSPVTILENTDRFHAGYWWFRIRYDGGKEGYIWGALLCSNADNPELNQVVRRCP